MEVIVSMLETLFKRYPCCLQNNITDCGVACISSILKYYKQEISFSIIRQYAKTDSQGTSIIGMLEASEKLGFYSKAVECDEKMKALQSEFSLPCIAHILLNKSYLHYIVIYKKTTNYLIVADPTEGIKKMTISDFSAIWTGTLILLTPTVNLAKSDISHRKNIVKQFSKLLKNKNKLILSIGIASIIATLIGIFTTYYYTFVGELILPYNDKNRLINFSVFVLIAYFIKNVINYVKSLLIINLSKRIDQEIVMSFFEHLIDLPMQFFGSRKIGEITSRFNDISKVRDAITNTTITLVVDVVMMLISILVLYEKNSYLLIVGFIIVVIYSIIIKLFNKHIQKINTKQMQKISIVNSNLVETINGIETLKSFNGEECMKAKINSLYDDYLNTSTRANKISALQNSLTILTTDLGSFIYLCVGMFLIISGMMSFGEVVTYSSLLIFFLTPIKNIVSLFPQIKIANIAFNRIQEILSCETESERDKNHQNIGGLDLSIVIRDLSFSYGNRTEILQNINMSINVGDRIGLAGCSGSGKTTLVKLIMKFYNDYTGSIRIGKFELSSLTAKSVRNRISYVSQDIYLFSGTIFENLKFANPKSSDDEIFEVCKKSKIDEFIKEMPMGYMTVLEEGGSNLSGGQKQKIALARALLKKTDILILDEATSNLDSISESYLGEVLGEFKNKLTIITIAHRLSTLMKSDKIYIIDKGKIIESGRHEELLSKKKEYYRMWVKQSGD